MLSWKDKAYAVCGDSNTKNARLLPCADQNLTVTKPQQRQPISHKQKLKSSKTTQLQGEIQSSSPQKGDPEWYVRDHNSQYSAKGELGTLNMA